MQKEVLIPSLRELNFYGEGKAESIKRGFAITSLRNPSDRYSFTRGETILANCQDDGEKIEVVVISNETKTLSSHEIPVLALDGAFNPEQAADMLKPIRTYENTTADSRMQAIVFLDAIRFDALPKGMQERLTNPKNSIVDLIKDRDYREIFFPTMCFWWAKFGGDFSNWTTFLGENNLITEEEMDWMEQYWIDSFERKTDMQMEDAYKATTSGFLQSISINPEDKFFKPFVLGFQNKAAI